MKRANFQSLTVQGVEQGKNTNFEAELRLFHEFLKNNTATCTMVCETLGIRQKNATRYKRNLEENGQLIEVFTAPCKYTKRLAAYLSTNPNIVKNVLRKSRNQLSLFE